MKLNSKNKILLVGFIISLYLSYSFAISKTFEYKKQYNSNQELSAVNDSPKVLSQLRFKEKQIDKWLLENNASSLNFQNELLKNLTQYSDLYHLKIIGFEQPHKFSQNGSSLLSYSFSLEGSFNGVLALLNKMENKQNLGTIKHVSSIKKTNYKTNQEYLITTVIIQKTENLK